jgi:hypothetical protein
MEDASDVIVVGYEDTRPGHEGQTSYFVLVYNRAGEEIEQHGPMPLDRANQYRDYRVNFPKSDPRE